MNIQKLLKKIDKNSLDSKKQLLTVQGAYKLKTCESIGTINSAIDQNQRSFVISDPHTPFNFYKKEQFQTISANSKLDEQLSNIQKMKNLYQSRQSKNQRKNRSIEKSSASGKKSLQKHLLKPSNTPSFNKMQNAKLIQQNQSSACKNLYTQKILQSSQISQKSIGSNNNFYVKAGNKKNIYQYPQSSLHNQDQDHQPYEQQPSYYNEQSLSHIANISHDISEDISLNKLQKKSIDNQSRHGWKQSNLTNQVNSFSDRSLNQKIQLKSQQCSCSCVPKEEFDIIMLKFQQRFSMLTQKIAQMQEQNKIIKKQHIQLRNQNIRYQQTLVQTNDQKQKILQQLKKQQQEKNQLQLMLKDVLYKRQKQRLQCSKQNTSRQNQRQKRMSNFSFAQSYSTTQLKQPRNSTGSLSKNSESKMKVQNLLNKLQIKVDRA